MRLRADRTVERRREAQERQEAWNKLSPAEKLKSLDERLGVGKGAKRQREKLNLVLFVDAVTEAPKKRKKKGGQR